MPAAKVRKAVFPAAGLGTRFLPATKAQPKEMLPLVDKPIIQYGVEEAMASGCNQILIITGRGKQAIEDHFDVSYELEKMLEERHKTDLLQIVRSISDMMYIAYVRQKEALGLGHAVLMAREMVGNEPLTRGTRTGAVVTNRTFADLAAQGDFQEVARAAHKQGHTDEIADFHMPPLGW